MKVRLYLFFQSTIQIMERNIKVIQSPSHKKYATTILLKGNYLEDHNFIYGDDVKVTLQRNKIVITKIEKQ